MGFKPKPTKEKLIRKLIKWKGKKLDAIATSIHEEIFAHTNCLNCAGCCKSIPPIVNRTDTIRIARFLGMNPGAFEQKYLTTDSDDDIVMNASPCPFLQTDNKCAIYEVRPKSCREYPHTGDYEFSANMRLHETNSLYCPAVEEILNKIELRFADGKLF